MLHPPACNLRSPFLHKGFQSTIETRLCRLSFSKLPMKCHWSTKAMTLLLSEKRICSSTQDGHERARNMINHKILVYLIFRSSYSTCNLTPPRREVPQAVVAVERPHFFVHSMFLVGPVLFFFHGMETSLNKSMFGCICETCSSKPKTNV